MKKAKWLATHLSHYRNYMVHFVQGFVRFRVQDFSPRTFPPTLMNKVAQIEAGLMKQVFIQLKLDWWKNFLLTRSLIDETILVYVVKMWCTLHNNDINQNLSPNIWWNTFFV